jgi:radical SAM protein with 4Fe4S-binding SPASM domain
MVQHTRGLFLQWHITTRCNLRCAHCYQEDYSQNEFGFHDLLAVVKQFEDLLDEVGREWAPFPSKGHITVTGGEPFLRGDFLDLLEVISAKKERFSFSVLSNGTLIDEAMARLLGKLTPVLVQVSIEGDKATNDRIRGPGTFDLAVTALKHLVRADVPCAISFTAQRENSHEFGAVAKLGRDLGVTFVWADRLIPWGSASTLRGQTFTPDETRQFFETMYEARAGAARSFCQTEIRMHRALQFLVGEGHPYRCAAGDTLITVQPNGDVFPCRRMPIRVGNLLEIPLVELYYKSDFLRALRDRNRINKGCEGCRHAKQCGGGLRCLAYAVTGDPFAADPGCWHAHSGSVLSRSRYSTTV